MSGLLSAMRDEEAPQPKRAIKRDDYGNPLEWGDFSNFPENIDIPLEARQEPPELSYTRPQTKTAAPMVELPANLDAEKGALSCIMLNPKYGFTQIALQLTPNHFYSPAHKALFQTLYQLQDDRTEINLITITDELKKWDLLEKVGGAAYVAQVFTFAPTHYELQSYIKIIREKAAARQLWQLGKKLQDEALTPQEDFSWIIEDAKTSLKTIDPNRGTGALPPLDDMSQLMGMNIPPAPEELVKGILHKGSKLIIGGTSKGRKTFSLMDLAISVATGTPWWGCETQKGRVCYINFEIQKPFFARRHDDICAAKGVRPEKGQLMCWTLRGLVDGIEKMSAEIIKILMEGDFSLIVFDPIYKALGNRDENKAGDVASLLNELEAIAVKTGAAIAFGAHYSKGNQAAKEAIDRIGGSGVFARDPDAILTMTPHALEECFTVEATLRNFPPQPPFVVRWEWPVFSRDEAQDPGELKQPKSWKGNKPEGADGQFKVKYSAEQIIEVLKEFGTSRSPSELLNLMGSQTGMGKSTFWNLWGKAKESPFVSKAESGRFIHLDNVKK